MFGSFSQTVAAWSILIDIAFHPMNKSGDVRLLEAWSEMIKLICCNDNVKSLDMWNENEI